MSRMKLKSPKKKRKINIIIYSLIIYSFFSFTFYSSLKDNKGINNEEFIKFLLKGGNIEQIEYTNFSTIVNKSFNYLLDIDLSKPNTLLNKTIFKENKNITINHNDDYSNMKELESISSYMEDPYKTDINNPCIYIYNSHQLENYKNTNLEIYGITPNVLMASYLFKEKLNKLGISTIVEETNLSEFLRINNWDYSSSYKASRIFMLDKINKYNSLVYLIDLHRDSVGRNLTTINIKGKNYAKVLFVVGKDYNGYEKNLELANRVSDLINKHYPGLSKGILKKGGNGVNGIYNQDLSSNSMLIELGGIENDINEVLNTLDALSVVFNELVKGENQ